MLATDLCGSGVEPAGADILVGKKNSGFHGSQGHQLAFNKGEVKSPLPRFLLPSDCHFNMHESALTKAGIHAFEAPVAAWYVCTH
jgi:hypothetical protein